MEGISSVDALYHDWKAGGHGSVDLRHALVHSCDVYFYTVGQRMGIETMASFAHQFGLGEETGIELPSERIGIVPSEAWKRKAKNEAVAARRNDLGVDRSRLRECDSAADGEP